MDSAESGNRQQQPKLPTPAQIAREEKQKRKRDDGTDDDADRAGAIRALVRCADNQHLKSAVIPFEDRPNAVTHTKFHVDNWKGDTQPCDAMSLPRFDKNDIPSVRDILEDCLECKTHSVGWTIISPQPTDDWHDGSATHSSRSYLGRGPLEAIHALVAEWAHHIKTSKYPDGISFTVSPAGIAPPQLVGSYEALPGLPVVTPQLEKTFTKKIRAHVASRFPNKISAFLCENNARLWGGGQLEPWWCELLQESIHVCLWASKGRDKQQEVAVSVYCLGVFDAKWLHSVWEDALLGLEINMDEFGVFKRTPTIKKRPCSICPDRDHHARVCPVWHHPDWPEVLRQRREERIKTRNERETTPAQNGESSHDADMVVEVSAHTAGPHPSRCSTVSTRDTTHTIPRTSREDEEVDADAGTDGERTQAHGVQTRCENGNENENENQDMPLPLYNEERATARTGYVDPNVADTIPPQNNELAIDENVNGYIQPPQRNVERELQNDRLAPPEPPPPPDPPPQRRHKRASPQVREARDRIRVHPRRGHQNTQLPYLRLQVSKSKSGLRTKAHLAMGSQNMRGRSHGGRSKWFDVEQHMLNQKIGILAMQETHLTENMIVNVNRDREGIRLFCSPNPDSPTSKGGVGVVLNKKLVRAQDVRMWEVVPGRAIVVSFDWHRQQKLTLLAVYALNDHRENKEFWTEIRETLARRADIPKPKAMLGDFNMVESSADRLPAKLNGADMSAEFQELLTTLNLIDGWREINPRRFSPTWHNAQADTYARLDRIYVSEYLFIASRNWRTESIREWCPGADHLPVSVELVNPMMPYVGEGRWAMGLHHLRNKKLFQEIVTAGIAMQEEVDALQAAPRDPSRNVQHAFADWKADTKTQSQEHARAEGQKNDRILKSLEQERQEILQDGADGEIDREDIPFEVLELEERIADISKRKKKRRKENARAKRRLYHETNSAEWRRMGRDKQAAETIPFLKDTRPEGERLADRRPADRRSASPQPPPDEGGAQPLEEGYVNRSDEMTSTRTQKSVRRRYALYSRTSELD
ncbi:hypothetical protein EXIGLDRAFT_701002 [Exidia glandulosa HHB12029]|uniref:Endonuclease/exonuclease/phosphatase domain-containing protein n=1 Tax=Exidia glandulosa HHB12029 TaxID=1314781 RepID=A0A166B767_EXIGL|nr:hypothetical protein EXIGLDRAFT_701002 [Exidia glandulosa HHB12029]